ncbi:hypothetical protein L210DRAFT_2726779 [Boletus edulis BED1]|uniref:Uncharacterized protein n=1 Tax=Boletus edulis BED1 TaxID=1328754 RepID=A0AAD4BA41_BOLED|nr:hypothetical protein L210DRAFT_2726779 [Boletus edulis BED1]
MYVDRTSFAPIRLLLNPSLVHLDVRVDDGAHTSFLAFLESYHTLCPNLKSLELHHSPRVPEVTAAISRAIPRSPNLETLRCNGIDEGALIHVIQSRCPSRVQIQLAQLPTSQSEQTSCLWYS